MSIDPAHSAHSGHSAPLWVVAAGPVPPPLSARAATRAGTVDTVDPGIPAAPSSDVLDQVAAAAECVRELARNNRELHFRRDVNSTRIIIEVRDMAGHVLRTIPPSKALEFVSDSPGRGTAWVA